jgi:predicted DCC family thiol-disulfide oxidoreductase YuxK
MYLSGRGRDGRARTARFFLIARSGTDVHHGLNMGESYLLIHNGKASQLPAAISDCAIRGGAWHLLRLGAAILEGWRDAAYALIARNRYQWFGRAVNIASF